MIPLSAYYSISGAAAPHIHRVLASATPGAVGGEVIDEAYRSDLRNMAIRYAGAAGIDESAVAGADGEPVSGARARAPLFRISKGVAVVPIRGVLTKSRGLMQALFGGFSVSEIADAIYAAASIEEIRTLILDVESPGGSVHGLDDAADALRAFRLSDSDRSIVSVGGMVASAAYYLASQADRVFVARGDLVGSIGSALVVYDYSGLFKSEGIRAIPIDSSPEDRPFKTAGAIGTEITDQQVAEFQRIVDSYFRSFLAAVERGRGERLRGERLRAIADGRVFVSGDDRPEGNPESIGLTDGISNIRFVIRTALAEELATEGKAERMRAISRRIDRG